jgi:hypothetical protein
MYVQRNIQANSCNNRSGKAISVTYSERASVALGIQHALRMRHIVICCLYGSTNIPMLSHKRHDSRKTFIEHKMCVLIFSTTFVSNIFNSKKNWARYDRKCTSVFMWSTLYHCQILMELEFPRQNFEKYSNINFHENESRGSRVVPCGRTDGRTELVIAFCNSASAPKVTLQLKRNAIPDLGFKNDRPGRASFLPGNFKLPHLCYSLTNKRF